jgi:hypothetical protein
MNSPAIKHKKTYEVRFTKFELLHLRDLMSISLPPEGAHTVSETLASLENRVMVESSLWQKLTNACVAVGLPVGDNAPDYIVAPSGIAPMGVFQLASEPPSGLPDDDDDEDADDDEDEVEGSNILELFKKMKQR